MNEMSVDAPSLTIDGRGQDAVDVLPVENPATGRRFADVPNASAVQTGSAVEAAASAFPSWSADSAQRAICLRAAAEAMRAHVDELGRLITLEQGKPLVQSMGEVEAAAQFFDEFAAKRPSIELERDDGQSYAVVSRRPLGVAVAITPWNAPLYVAGMKVAPALAAGNTVVLKPSPETPLATLRFGEVVRDHFPPGVLNVVAGGNHIGPILTGHPLVRVVSFTGSIGTGKRIAASVANDLKHVILELGGNDAAIVCEDAVSDAVLDVLFAASFGNAGQVCSGIKRVYVHKSVHDDLIDGMAERARRWRVGSGLDPDSQMGPLTTAAQLRTIEEMIEEATMVGGTIVAGGSRLPGPGHFHQPTIVTGLPDEASLVSSEQFGPALPIVSFDSDDEVVRRVNEGQYGLGGSVWTHDFERGISIADRLETGMSWVNSHKGADPSLPFGGSKWSGLGFERGRWGLDCFTEIHVTSGERL